MAVAVIHGMSEFAAELLLEQHRVLIDPVGGYYFSLLATMSILHRSISSKATTTMTNPQRIGMPVCNLHWFYGTEMILLYILHIVRQSIEFKQCVNHS